MFAHAWFWLISRFTSPFTEIRSSFKPENKLAKSPLIFQLWFERDGQHVGSSRQLVSSLHSAFARSRKGFKLLTRYFWSQDDPSDYSSNPSPVIPVSKEQCLIRKKSKQGNIAVLYFIPLRAKRVGELIVIRHKKILPTRILSTLECL